MGCQTNSDGVKIGASCGKPFTTINSPHEPQASATLFAIDTGNKPSASLWTTKTGISSSLTRPTVSQTSGTNRVSHRGKPTAIPASRNVENPSHKINPSTSMREAIAPTTPVPSENPSRTMDSWPSSTSFR